MPQTRPTIRSVIVPPDSPSPLLHPPVEQRVSFKVHQVNAKLAQVANALFRTHDLDLISSRILVILLEKQQLKVGDLIEMMVLPQSTISHQLQRLDKRGLIQRTRRKEDNRSVALTLTAAGRQLATACNALSLDIYGHMTKGLSDEELDQLRVLLGRMFATLESYGASHHDT